MNIKKVFWILILILVIAGIVVVIFSVNNSNLTQKINSADDNTKKIGSIDKADITTNTVKEEVKLNTEYEKIELEDGTLYTLTGKEEKSDMIIGTNYFDTTITDIYYNPKNYLNKKIKIEGMYLLSGPNLPYTFVGRYALNTLCPTCPAGYSAIEFQLQGNIDRELKDEEDWIKIIGTLEKGNDETTNYQDYYYLKVLNLEIMNERGQDTVNN